MKSLVPAVVVALASSVSFAAERNIYDLMYLPKAGTNFGLTDLSYVKQKMEIDRDGNEVESNSKGYILTQTLGRSLADNFLLSASLGHTHIDSQVDFTVAGFGSGEEGTSVKGLSDPTLNLRFRVLETEIKIDVIGSWLIGLDESKESDSESDNKNGGHELSLGAEVGNNSSDFQLVGGALFTRSLKSTTKDKESGERTKDDAHNSYSFYGKILAGLSSNLFVNAQAGASFTDKYDDNDDGTTASQTSYQVGAELNYLACKDLMLKAGVLAIDTHQNSIDTWRSYLITVGANYQF